MTTANILCLLCGSLLSCIAFYLCFIRQNRIDERLIRHVRRSAYLRGWQDGKDAAWRAE